MNQNAYNNGVAVRNFIATNTTKGTGAVKSAFAALSSFVQGVAKGEQDAKPKAKTKAKTTKKAGRK